MIFLDKVLKKKKKVHVALTKNFGIGLNYSKSLCNRVGLNSNARYTDLTPELLKTMARLVARETLVDVELLRSKQADKMLLINLNSYRGLRHKQRLPVNGQNTKNNAKTARKDLY